MPLSRTPHAGRASRRIGCRWPAFRPQGFRCCHFRGRHGGQGIQRGQEFFHVQAFQAAWRVHARLLLPANIPQARPGACQPRLPGGVAGVSEGAAETERGKTQRQRKTGEGTGRAGTEAAGTPGSGYGRLARHGLSLLNIARHFLKEQERREKEALLHWQAPQGLQERLPRFKHWLGKRSPHLGNLWRFRKRIAPGVEVRQREFTRVGTLASPYIAYRKMVTKLFPEKMDESRLDATIALYMRCAGYTMQEVANELYRHTPARPKGQNCDERIDYGRRVVWYAFGAAGDIDIANVNPTPKHIKKFVSEIEKKQNQHQQIAYRHILR